MIVWHVETSSGPRFEWARDEEHLRQQVIEYNNTVLNDGEADEQLAEDATLEEAIEKVEESENFSKEEVHGAFMFDQQERDTILAALRLWQHHLEGTTPCIVGLDDIARNDHDDPLGVDEVDDLCERINI